MLILEGCEYLSEKEISKRCGLSVHWFRKARYEGKSPTYHKLNKKVYYRADNVDNWLKDHMCSIS
jgi:predicted DNA-binding transcriptional regulator AlpA